MKIVIIIIIIRLLLILLSIISIIIICILITKSFYHSLRNAFSKLEANIGSNAPF